MILIAVCSLCVCVKYSTTMGDVALRAAKAPWCCVAHTTVYIVHLATGRGICMEKEGKCDSKTISLISIIREELHQRAVPYTFTKQKPRTEPKYLDFKLKCKSVFPLCFGETFSVSGGVAC